MTTGRMHFALAAGLLLSGCAGTVSLDAEKALIAGHTLHDGAVQIATIAFKAGKCSGACEVTVRTKLDQAEKLLLDADGLSDPANITADVNAAVALVVTLLEEGAILIPKFETMWADARASLSSSDQAAASCAFAFARAASTVDLPASASACASIAAVSDGGGIHLLHHAFRIGD